MRELRLKIIIAFFVAAVFTGSGSLAQTETISVPKVEYKAEGLRDPFQGYKEEEKKPVKEEPVQIKPLPSLTVQGIVWGGNFPQAIINNNVVKVGDTIEEVKVVKIDKNGIEVLYAGRTYFISSPASGGVEKKP